MSRAYMLEKLFEEWLTAGGAQIYDIRPAAFPGNLRGIEAVDGIEPGRDVKLLTRPFGLHPSLLVQDLYVTYLARTLLLHIYYSHSPSAGYLISLIHSR